VLFAVGSLVFALAQSMGVVILGRVLQGLGGGGLDVLAEIILADMTTLQERSFYLGLMAIPISVGNILGPSISAIFASFLSWRWIGWVNLPFLGVACPLVVFFLRLRSIQLDASLTANLRRLDWVGMILFVIGITILVLPLSWAGALYPWVSWRTLLPLLLGVAVLIIFTIYEAYPATPIVPYRIFSSKTANMTIAGAFTHGMVIFSILLYLPLFYQAIELETVIGSAVSLLPTSITSVVVAAGSMMMVAVVGGGYRWVIWFAWITITLGTGLLALLDLDSPSSMRLGIPILWGVGVALLRLLLLPMQASVRNVDDTGLAIGLLLTVRLLGGLVGLAVAATIFSTVFSTSISSVGRLTGPLTPLNNADEAIAFITELRKLDVPSEVLDPVLKVYLKSFRAIYYTMTGIGGLGFITSLFTEELALRQTELGQQRFEE
jgi:MFS family permease